MKHINLFEEFLNEAEGRDTLAELNEMTMGQLERIADYADMIKERMTKGEELESWMYSQLTVSLENLNSVHDAMDGNDSVTESDYTNARADLSAKSHDIFLKRKELRDKVNDLNQKADDQKSSIQAQIATLKMSLLELDNQKIKISATILDLNNKLNNL
jgi:chromosome segregation ATPase